MAIVGHVGCGKSSLLSAVLGDIRKLDGHVYLQVLFVECAKNVIILNTDLSHSNPRPLVLVVSCVVEKYKPLSYACSVYFVSGFSSYDETYM